MAKQGDSRPFRRRLRRAQSRRAAVLFVAMLAAGAALAGMYGRGGAPARLPASAPPAALPSAEDPGGRAALVTLLRSDRPEDRAAAAATVGRREDRAMAAALVPRMSDQDWRVRAAAFEAMRRLGQHLPGAPDVEAPLRDTPVEQRERLILSWVSAWRGADDPVPPSPASPELCELYAGDRHWLTGPVLAEACLACHAPPTAFAPADFARCAECHRAAHDSWSSSAHARSLTHLALRRVDPETKQIAPFDAGAREGLDCVACHRPADAPATSTLPPPGTEDLRPPHRFAPVAAGACAACHSDAQREWEQWRAAPRPVVARWPPGELSWESDAAAQTCVDCHMPVHGRTGSAAERDHGFAARRDPALLRGGLHARIEPPVSGRAAQLVLTNLAGHDYPTGTTRRALRVEVVFDGDESTRRLLTRLAAPHPLATGPRQDPLAPTEQRRLDLPDAPGASRVACEIVYERDRFNEGAYELPLHRVEGTLDRPIAPSGQE